MKKAPIPVEARIKAMQEKLGKDYNVYDISEEEYRIVKTEFGEHQINDPVILIIRKGGSTHRVIDALDQTHCYAAPESGKSVLIWKEPGLVSF